jgi:hypothetical protein
MTEFNAPHRLYLRRFVAFPEDRLTLPPMEIDVPILHERGRPKSLHSANAYAAVRGIAHIRDSAAGVSNQVPGLDRLVTVGGVSPRSELSVPIVVDGMIVGTLNLESSYANSFLPQIQLISAFAAVAGLAIAMKRRETVRSLAERYALASEGFHEVSKLALLIEKIPAESVFADELREAIVDIDTPDRRAREQLGHSIELRELLKDRAEAVKLVDLKVSGALTAVVGSAYVPALNDVFGELFGNARKHSISNFPVFVSGEEVQLVSGDYLLLVCKSQPSLPIQNEKLLRSLYRIPQPDQDGGTRLHLGCFTIGEDIRGLGGNVFGGRNPRGFFETHLFIPKEVFK